MSVIVTAYPTRTKKEAKGYQVLEEKILSDTKVTRLSQVDNSVTPYPFVIECFMKKAEESIWKYCGGDAYETLEEAKLHQVF